MKSQSLMKSPHKDRPAKALSVFWFRRDLRLDDNRGLRAALESGRPVLPIFIFDQEILNKIEDRDDARVSFIYEALQEMDRQLRALGSSLFVYHGKPLDIFADLVGRFDVAAIFTNRDYEPYALERDQKIRELIEATGGSFYDFKDQVVFEQNEVTKDDGKPYTVFTPFSKKWLARLTPDDLRAEKSEELTDNYLKSEKGPMPSLKGLGFEPTSTPLPFIRPTVEPKQIEIYESTRNIPGDDKSTTRVGLHLRFGTVSIRDLVRRANKAENKTWLKELIWREFFMQILWHFPHVVKGAFRPEYNKIEWRDDRADFEAWKQGKTGFPIVDAGMRELNATGYMHNRVRMIAASVLIKHLLIDWRKGEAYFARKLLDFELSSNNGNWQWVAGTGCDAAPYFRVFNPDLQQKKFDPKAIYIKKWVPEYGTSKQIEPIVDATTARTRALRAYKSALSRKAPESEKVAPKVKPKREKALAPIKSASSKAKSTKSRSQT